MNHRVSTLSHLRSLGEVVALSRTVASSGQTGAAAVLTSRTQPTHLAQDGHNYNTENEST